MSVLKNKSILIVESDDAILNILSSRLKKREMIVITATDGYDGYTVHALNHLIL